MHDKTATYSPDDNKLRLYTVGRLDPDVYARVRAAGFIWAPKQDLFVAPAWTPEREDLLIEMCGEIGDEDTSLIDRAEERADRFGGYVEARTQDATREHAAVSQLADAIPFGQPILVGHHSERHARRDAERIETGMRRALRAFETAEYWKHRAAGAIRHAKYKERPDVRARRIKGLEAELRKVQKHADHAERAIRLWRSIDNPSKWKARNGSDSKPSTWEAARTVANYDNVSQCFPLADYPRDAPASQYEGTMSLWSALEGIITPAQAQAIAIDAHERTIRQMSRWVGHLTNRLAYERAMLAEAGGTAADKTGPEKGGACRCWASPRGGWSYIRKVNKVSVSVDDNFGNGGRNFSRTIPFDKLTAVMSAAEVQAATEAGRVIPSADGTGFHLAPEGDRPTPPAPPKTETPAAPFDVAALRESVKAGVQVVAAPQLFPTPADLARKMAEVADIQPGHRALEPSAGTGRLIEAIQRAFCGADCGRLVAVEQNPRLVAQLHDLQRRTLYANDENFGIIEGDFLACAPGLPPYGKSHAPGTPVLGLFDRIVMNPPFSGGADVRHIQHAARFLKPGGRLVALCANGPRQREALAPIASAWDDLPEGSFSAEGTNVRVAMVTIDGPVSTYDESAHIRAAMA